MTKLTIKLLQLLHLCRCPVQKIGKTERLSVRNGAFTKQHSLRRQKDSAALQCAHFNQSLCRVDKMISRAVIEILIETTVVDFALKKADRKVALIFRRQAVEAIG